MRKALAMVLAASCVFGLAASGGSGSELQHDQPGRIQGIQKRSANLRALSVSQPMYAEQEACEGRDTARLARGCG